MDKSNFNPSKDSRSLRRLLDPISIPDAETLATGATGAEVKKRYQMKAEPKMAATIKIIDMVERKS